METAGDLVGYTPQVVAFQAGPARQLWLTRQANEWCFPRGKHPDRVGENALAMALSQLDAFVMGKTLIEWQDMKHLENGNKEVWTIRSFLDPKVRLFGWFVAQRKFIVVHGKRRDHLELKSGPKWDKAIGKVVTTRATLFPGILPHAGFSFADYVG